MNEKLELIRQKCIEANPEILETLSLSENAEIIHTRTISRPIRLADVLLAIREKDVVISAFQSDEGACFGKVVDGNTNYDDRFEVDWSLAFWNLRKDDLNEQSQETISFIASLFEVV